MSADVEPAVALDRLRLWLEGEPLPINGRDALVAPGACNVDLDDLDLGSGAVFVPEAFPRELSCPTHRYGGSFDLLGSELTLGEDVFVQLEGYSSAPYLAITYPTALSLTTPEDVAALHADIVVASATGELPAYLLSPLVTLVDQRLWMAPLLGVPTPPRVFVDESGTLSEGPLGGLGEHLDEDHRRAVARFVGGARVVRALAARLQQPLRLRSCGAPRGDSVFVVEVADGSTILVDAATKRVSRVPGPLADTVEEDLASLAADGTIPQDHREVFKALHLERYAGELR